MLIREATLLDRDTVQSLYRSAFAEDERETISKLAVDLLSAKATWRILSLVAETEKKVAGHAAFSPVSLENAKNFHGYILAPLAVLPAYQKRGIGSKLVTSGLQQLSAMGVDMVFVYGDPGYYNRFGFSVEASENYIPPYDLQYPFGWQGKVISEGATDTTPGKISCVKPLCDPALW